MLDCSEQAERLLAAMEAALPIPVTCKPQFLAMLRERPEFKDIGPRAMVEKVAYTNDEGGIVCSLDFRLGQRKTVAVVSLTHLSIDPTHPLARDIASYQYNRIKALRAQQKGKS